MHLRHHNPRKSIRRHDWTSLWLAAFCALLMVSPTSASALSLSQTRQASAQYEAVLWWLETQVETCDASAPNRAAVLKSLCDRAGLDEVRTAHFISNFENWAAHDNTLQSTLAPVFSLSQRHDKSSRLLAQARAPHESSRAAHLLICRFSE